VTSQKSNLINYTFKISSGKQLTFTINIEEESAVTRAPFRNKKIEYPEWTLLENHQCKCCPLLSENDPYCPTAVRTLQVMEAFQGFTSIEKVDVTVKTAHRTYFQNSDLQSSLNSMLGLQMATSGCPTLDKFRPMATFHVPFSSFSETLYRSITAYLMKQYFAHIDGDPADWDLVGLCSAYKELEGLNKTFSKRIEKLGQHDAISNAIVMFFASSIIAAGSIEEKLEEYRAYFTGKSSLPPDN